MVMPYTHLFYCSIPISIKVGGPSGYLANLIAGLKILNNTESKTINFDTSLLRFIDPEPTYSQKVQGIRGIIFKYPILKYLYVNYFSIKEKKRYLSEIKRLKTILIDIDTDLEKKIISDDKLFSVHCNTVWDAVIAHNTIKKTGKRILLVLTSHSPCTVATECDEEIYKKFSFSIKKRMVLKEIWRQIDEKAFVSADVVIFPSMESMEPYYSTEPLFHSWIKDKDIRYIQTGVVRAKTSLSKDEIYEKYKLPKDKKIILFLGRHSSVKGYFLLKEVAASLFDKNAIFVVCGRRNDNDHNDEIKNWYEVGYVDKSELLKICDCLVIPNKRTFFDLSILEAMSCGVPILASNTGGNKTIKSFCDDLILFEYDYNSFKNSLELFLSLSKEQLSKIASSILDCYENNYDEANFASRYVKLISNIYKDYTTTK